jgi:hypothetical protein
MGVRYADAQIDATRGQRADGCDVALRAPSEMSMRVIPQIVGRRHENPQDAQTTAASRRAIRQACAAHK